MAVTVLPASTSIMLLDGVVGLGGGLVETESLSETIHVFKGAHLENAHVSVVEISIALSDSVL